MPSYSADFVVNREASILNVAVSYFMDPSVNPDTGTISDWSNYGIGYINATGTTIIYGGDTGLASDTAYMNILQFGINVNYHTGTVVFRALTYDASIRADWTVKNYMNSLDNLNIFGGNDANLLITGLGHDHVGGNNGNDFIDTGDGDDYLDGGADADTMVGGVGNDTYVVDNAADRVVESSGSADRVNTSVSYMLSAGEGIEILGTTSVAGSSAINLIGNGVAQTIYGNAGVNTLNGAGGADTLQGFSGDDTYYVDNAGDKVFEAAGGGADRVRTSISYTLSVGQEVETLSTLSTLSTGSINLVGNALGQTLQGNVGTNLINGKEGVDRLYGYDGKDLFGFSSAISTASRDFIMDFSHAADTIRLTQSVFSALGTGQLAASAFKDLGDPGAKLDATDRIVYNDDTGGLYYDRDGSGSTYALVQFASITTKPTNIDHTDFIVLA